MAVFCVPFYWSTEPFYKPFYEILGGDSGGLFFIDSLRDKLHR